MLRGAALAHGRDNEAPGAAAGCAGANAGPTVARSGEEQCTHPFDAIVTIGTMSSSKQASWAGSVV